MRESDAARVHLPVHGQRTRTAARLCSRGCHGEPSRKVVPYARCIHLTGESVFESRPRQVSAFFDPQLARNQYLSEYALHRSLLVSPNRVLSPAAAQVFFVPFYARLAYADKKASRRVRRLQANLTSTLAECLRSSAAWKRAAGRDHFVAMSSTRDPRKLYGEAWPLLKHAVLVRIEAAPDRRYQRKLARKDDAHIVLPYFVPNFAEDDRVARALKRYPVCFFGTATHPSRRRALRALRHVEGARLHMAAKAAFDPSLDATTSERMRTAETRRAMRQCKLCLVPAGVAALLTIAAHTRRSWSHNSAILPRCTLEHARRN